MRCIKLDVVMKSGSVVRLHVTKYSISYVQENLTAFDFTTTNSNRRAPLHIDLTEVAAIVRHR